MQEYEVFDDADDQQKEEDVPPQDINDLTQLQTKAKENIRVIRALQLELVDLKSGDFRFHEIESEITEARIKASRFRRRRNELVQKQVASKKEELKLKQEEFLAENGVDTLDQKKKEVVKIILDLAERADLAARRAYHEDRNLAARLRGLSRGAFAATEALNRAPSLVKEADLEEVIDEVLSEQLDATS